MKKACTFVKNVIVRCWIKLISFLMLIIFLNFILDNKGHIAKWKTKILTEDQPIMILAIKPQTLIILKYVILVTQFVLIKVFVVITVKRTPLIQEFDLIILNYIRITFIVPYDIKWIVCCSHLYLNI